MNLICTHNIRSSQTRDEEGTILFIYVGMVQTRNSPHVLVDISKDKVFIMLFCLDDLVYLPPGSVNE